MDKRAQELQLAVNKKFGEDTVILGHQLLNQTTPRITSGSLSLNVAMGGGWPANRWHEIYGEASVGKTMLLLKTIAANQELDPNFLTFWVAAEDFDPTFAVLCGCDLERIMVLDANLSEFVFDTTLEALGSRAFDLVVIDSLPMLVPEREDRDESGEVPVGRQAWLNGQFLRKSRKAMKRSLTKPDRPVTAFVVNQWRDRIITFGDPRITPGGRAKNYVFNIRTELKRDEWIDDLNDVRCGQVIKILVFKNKSARPQQVAVLDFYFADSGTFLAGQYDSLKEIVALGLTREIVTRTGSWYHFEGDKWQGKKELLEQLRYDKTLQEAITKAVMASLSPPAPRKLVRRPRG